MKNKKFALVTLGALFLLPISLGTLSSDFFVTKAEEILPLLAIDRENVKIGQPVGIISSIENFKNYSWKWYVDGVETENKTKEFVPTYSTLENWLEVHLCYGDTTIASDKVYVSSLPVVYINTENNLPITSREDYIDAKMYIQPNNHYVNSYEGKIQIKGRGTSSWHYEKKPFKIKLNKKENLFDFGKTKHYVLLANYLDPSCMRNEMAFNLARSFGLTTTDSTCVDVILNGEYQGNYQIAEHIRVGKNIVDIFDWEDLGDELAEKIAEISPTVEAKLDRAKDEIKTNLNWITSDVYRLLVDSIEYKPKDLINIPNSLNGGYLFEISNSTIGDVSHFTTQKGIDVGVNKPEYANSNVEMFDWIQNYLNGFEEAIYSKDGYNKEGVHYSELADIDSMVKYWLVNEILCNEDASSRSRYAYIPLDGKLTFGPVWDFDISSFAYRSFRSPYTWAVTGTINGMYTGQEFFTEFVDDPYFQIKAQELYWEARWYLNDFVKEDGFISSYEDNMYESLIANENKWLTKDTFVQRSSTGTNGDVAIFKDFFEKRLAWLDKVFDTEKSTTEALYISNSSHPFHKSENITIDCKTLNTDTEEHGSDFIFNEGDNIVININSTLPNLNLYVNGIKYIENVEAGKDIEIPLDLFANNSGIKNVISVTNGEETNYITIKTEGYREIEHHGSTALSELGQCKQKDHKLVKVQKGTLANNCEIIKDCYYCEICNHFYESLNGKNMIFKKDLMISDKRQDIKMDPIGPEETNKKTNIPVGLIISITIGSALAIGLSIALIVVVKKLKK